MRQTMKLNKLTKFALFAIVLFLIVLLSLFPGWYKKQPKLNPHPQYFIMIHGHVAARLRGKLNITFQQGFMGQSDKCTYIKNIFALEVANPYKSIHYQPKINTHGDFTLRIPTDRFTPGYCQWSPWNLYINIGKKVEDQSTIPLLNALEIHGGLPPKHAIIECDLHSEDCVIKGALNESIPRDYPNNKSYSIHLNFILNKGDKGA